MRSDKCKHMKNVRQYLIHDILAIARNFFVAFSYKYRLVLVLSLPLLVLACDSDDDNKTTPPPPESPVEESIKLRFIAVGDVGTGSTEQYKVAAAMQNKCEQDGCDFVLLLGDNIYNNGVDSIDDTQFSTKFEQPYQYIDVPFYVVLGNHDYGGDGLGYEYYKSLFQLDYTGVSSKWNMPHHYYEFVERNVTFIALDTNGQMFGIDSEQRQDVSTWITGSQSDWKIVFGHHPYKSNGPHGNAGKYEGISGIPILSGDDVKQFAEDIWCGKADVYISGHDHSRQWLDASCQGTVLLVSGAGAKTTSLSDRNPWLFQTNTIGFIYIVIDAMQLVAEFIDANGQIEFSEMIQK